MRPMSGPGVCFVTCRTWPEISASDRLVEEALGRRGVSVVGRAWNDPGGRFDGFGAVVLRSNWDYHFTPDEFVAWLDRWEAAGAPIWNPPALVRWNLTERYLLDLEAAGIPIVSTVVMDEPSAEAIGALMTRRQWAAAVVKPLVSASAYDTALVRSTDRALIAEAVGATLRRPPVLVQPFVEEIRTRGEWSMVLIDGAVTHAALKRPGPDDFRVQARFGGTTVAAAPPPDAVAAAHRVLAALPAPPLYARVDGVETRRGFLVMEVELNEPGLFFSLAPEAAERFADAVVARLPDGRSRNRPPRAGVE